MSLDLHADWQVENVATSWQHLLQRHIVAVYFVADNADHLYYTQMLTNSKMFSYVADNCQAYGCLYLPPPAADVAIVVAAFVVVAFDNWPWVFVRLSWTCLGHSSSLLLFVLNFLQPRVFVIDLRYLRRMLPIDLMLLRLHFL